MICGSWPRNGWTATSNLGTGGRVFEMVGAATRDVLTECGDGAGRHGYAGVAMFSLIARHAEAA
jgi:hypothetical protein